MKKHKIIVVGCGRLGATIATKMSEYGHDVIVIDSDPDSFRKLNDSFSGYEQIGDGTDLTVLENANIKNTKTVVLTTNSDNTNIFIAHVCFYLYDIPNIYVRLTDNDKGTLFENTTIKPIYPFKLSLNAFLEMVGEPL